jgi:hypothetical protein
MVTMSANLRRCTSNNLAIRVVEVPIIVVMENSGFEKLLSSSRDENFCAQLVLPSVQKRKLASGFKGASRIGNSPAERCNVAPSCWISGAMTG